MDTDTFQKRLTRIINSSIAPILKENAYKKSKRNFCKEEELFYRVVTTQASVWGSKGAGRFTLNLNIAFPPFHELWTNKEFPKSIFSAAFIVQQRIGRLTPNNKDLWWDVANDEEEELATKELKEVFIEFGLPFIEKFDLDIFQKNLNKKSISELGTMYNHDVIRASVLNSQGKIIDAKEVLDEAMLKTQNAGFKETLKTIKHRL